MNLETTRLRGRPRNRWQDELIKNGRLVWGTGWRKSVHNREEWKKILRTARNCHFLHMPINEYETWLYTFREYHKLWVFKNRVLRNIFGPGRQEVTGDWRKLHSAEELHNFYTLPDINKIVKSRRMRWSVYVAHTRQKKYLQDFDGEI